MAEIPESDILELFKSRLAPDAVESVFVAALQSAGVERMPTYTPKDVVAIGAAITEASNALFAEATALDPKALEP
ncbi:MAG: hypothetical protein KGR26_00825 [Cyanobacteria bacterium REEB65]|nr:hypothetical protein [Cyanobacteria bacterium REEB65]